MSENMFGFDPNEVSTEIGIEAGEYPAVINTAKMSRTKESGHLMFTIAYKIIGDKYAGKIFDYNNFVIKGPTSNGAKFFFKLVEDCGLEKGSINNQSDLAKLIGRPITIKVGKRANKDGVEEKYSSVLGFFKSEVATESDTF